jgi:hypothetical protein
LFSILACHYEDCFLETEKRVKKHFVFIILTTTLFFTPACRSPDTDDVTVNEDSNEELNEKLIIHSIYDLNKDPVELDSHAGEEQYSHLEMDFNSYVLVPSATLNPSNFSNPIYARVKKTKSGAYLLFYHNNNIGTSIAYSTSSDLKNWSKGQYFQQAKGTTSTPAPDRQLYHGADAVVLKNGDILAAFSFRPNGDRFLYPELNGIMLRRSTDDGKTWGPEQVIWRGFNWEPYLLQLPSGRIQCYFTDGSGRVDNTANSGTSLVYSDDNGLTWLPADRTYKAIRQLRITDNGNHFWTDQMPVVRLLNDGHSMAGIMESNMSTVLSGEKFQLSFVYCDWNGSGNGWPELTGNQVGPADRTPSNVEVVGAAGYLSQFPSGETVMSGTSAGWGLRIGDSHARVFNGLFWSTTWLKPFQRAGYWGSTELDDSHALIGTVHSSGASTASDGVHVARFILNHRIDAPSASITIDGDNRDWRHTDALFIGSESPAQTVFRAAYNAQYLYILAEQLSPAALTGSSIQLYVNSNNSGDSVQITVNPSGLASAAVWNNGTWETAPIPGLQVKCNVPEETGNSDAKFGYLAEIAIPLSAFIHSDTGVFRLNAVTTNNGKSDTFTYNHRDAGSTNSSEWQYIKKK